LREGQLSRP
jgi:serine/threonine protein kinase